MKIPVVACNATYAKISCADFTGIEMIEPPREGPLNRAKVLISGIVKHALRPVSPENQEKVGDDMLDLPTSSTVSQPSGFHSRVPLLIGSGS